MGAGFQIIVSSLAAERLNGVCDPACKMNNSQPSKKKRCQGIPGKRHTLNLSKGMKARNSMAVEESIRDSPRWDR